MVLVYSLFLLCHEVLDRRGNVHWKFSFFLSVFLQKSCCCFSHCCIEGKNLCESQISFPSCFSLCFVPALSLGQRLNFSVAGICSMVEIKLWGLQWCANSHSHTWVGDLNPKPALAAIGDRLHWAEFYHGMQCYWHCKLLFSHSRHDRIASMVSSCGDYVRI